MARFKKAGLLLLLIAAAALVGFALPDGFILHPPHGPMDSAGATRATLPFQGGVLEIWTAHSRPRPAPGKRPDVYVLRFYGNADRADPHVADEAAGWAERDTEFWGVNLPGYGGSSGGARLKSIGPAALTAYDALRRRAGRDRPIVVFGTSLGSTAALCVAARRYDVAGVMLQNPPPLRQIILRGWGWWNLWLVAGPAAAAVPGDLDSLANARAARMRGVFLLAEKDEVIAPKYQRLVVEAYAGEKRTIPLPGAHHNTPIAPPQARELHEAITWILQRPGPP